MINTLVFFFFLLTCVRWFAIALNCCGLTKFSIFIDGCVDQYGIVLLLSIGYEPEILLEFGVRISQFKPGIWPHRLICVPEWFVAAKPWSAFP